MSNEMTSLGLELKLPPLPVSEVLLLLILDTPITFSSGPAPRRETIQVLVTSAKIKVVTVPWFAPGLHNMIMTGHITVE